MKSAYPAVGLAVAAFLLMGEAVAEPARQGQIASLRGEVSVRLQGGEWQPAAAGMTLGETDEVKTGKGGFAEILLDNGEVARLELKEESLFRIHTLGSDSKSGDKVTLLDLAIGKVLVHAEKLKGDSKFEVRTPTSTTGVRGTEFEVSVAEKS